MKEGKAPRIAIYARVSTVGKGQSTEMQLADLREYCQSRDWTNTVEFIDEGVSGSKASRPALDKMMADARRRKFDVLLVWRLDRFGRTIKQLVGDMYELTECGVKFVSLKDAFDMTTSMGRAMAGMLSVFAALERDMIQERVLSGMANARSKGRFPGFKRQVLDLDGIRAMIAGGQSLRSCAKSLLWLRLPV